MASLCDHRRLRSSWQERRDKRPGWGSPARNPVGLWLQSLHPGRMSSQTCGSLTNALGRPPPPEALRRWSCLAYHKLRMALGASLRFSWVRIQNMETMGVRVFCCLRRGASYVHLSSPTPSRLFGNQSTVLSPPNLPVWRAARDTGGDYQ